MPAAAEDGPVLPGLSAGCIAPAGDISSNAPLPNLTSKLKGLQSLRVLAIGSSASAAAAGIGSTQSYPAQLEQILERIFRGLDVEIVNRGVSGEVAASTAERLKVQVAMERPDLVLWQVGTTDALARVPVEQFAATVRDTLVWLKAHGIDTVLVGLQYTPNVSRDEHYNGIRTALRDVAVAENVLLVRRYDAMRFIEVARGAERAAFDELRAVGDDACVAEHIARAVVVSAFLAGKRAPSAKTQ